MIYSEQKFDFEIKLLENWIEKTEIRSAAINIIDEQIEKKV